jgi:hypothetical protein
MPTGRRPRVVEVRGLGPAGVTRGAGSLGGRPRLPGVRDAGMPGCRSAGVPGCPGAGVPECRSAGVPGCPGAGVPECRGARVPGCRGGCGLGWLRGSAGGTT